VTAHADSDVGRLLAGIRFPCCRRPHRSARSGHAVHLARAHDVSGPRSGRGSRTGPVIRSRSASRLAASTRPGSWSWTSTRGRTSTRLGIWRRRPGAGCRTRAWPVRWASTSCPCSRAAGPASVVDVTSRGAGGSGIGDATGGASPPVTPEDLSGGSRQRDFLLRRGTSYCCAAAGVGITSQAFATAATVPTCS
jgi:hypothetical protein